jgi:hypothetical protein
MMSEKGGAGNGHGENINANRVLVHKSEGKDHFEDRCIIGG